MKSSSRVPERRRVHRPRLIADLEPSHDHVFTRLILDLQLAQRAQRKIACGELAESKRADAEAFEQGAFQHLFNYLNAKAWTRA